MGLLGKIFGQTDKIIKDSAQIAGDMARNRPQSEEDIPEGPGEMVIDDVFRISGRGVVATGCISKGSFRVGQPVTIETANGEIESSVAGVEAFRKLMTIAVEGDNVGLLLANISKDQISAGDIVKRK